MERYQQGRIYAIRSNETDEVYIGSTCLPLPKRLWKHRHDFKQHKRGKRGYITSFKILEHADHYIELIELYSCNSKEELCRREGQIMREHATRVNKQLAGRTKAEYAAEHLDDTKEYNKKWVLDNKEAVKEYKKKWAEDNKEKTYLRLSKKIICECGSTYTVQGHCQHIKTDKHKAYIAAQ